MTDFYWAIPQNQTHQGDFWITPEGDFLPLDSFKTWNEIGSCLYQGNNPEYQGKTILLIHATIPDNSIQALAEEIEGDPLTLEATEQVKITMQYGGSSLTEFKERLLLNWGFDLPDTREVIGDGGVVETVPFLISSQMGPNIR